MKQLLVFMLCSLYFYTTYAETNSALKSYSFLKLGTGIGYQHKGDFRVTKMKYEPSVFKPLTVEYGIRFGALSLSGEFAYRSNELDDADGAGAVGKTQTTNFMLNGKLHLPVNAYQDLYLGGGAGLAWASIVDTEFDNRAKDTTIASQLFAGIETKMSKGLGYFVEYKVLQVHGAELTGDGISNAKYDYLHSSIMLGINLTY